MNNTTVSRILSIIAGIVFVFSGVIKLLNVARFQDLIIQYGLGIFQYLAPLIILFEILLGMALVLGIMKRITAIVSICVLLIFTGAYTYGYLVNSVEDCGCFGNLVKSTPTITYTRNIVLIAILLIVAFIDEEVFYTIPKWKSVILLSVLIPSVFAAGLSFRVTKHHYNSHPFEGKEIKDTSLLKYVGIDDKSKLILFMSYHCQHCWNSIENYKAYTENGYVDTALCYALCNTVQQKNDSASLYFKESYPEIKCQELIRDSVRFVDATPTAFFIKNNRVEKIIIGGLPSPFLIFQ